MVAPPPRMSGQRQQTFRIVPLTANLWPDFETLFGANGACGGCWCMWWRIERKQYELQKGDGNKRVMHDIVDAGTEPGLLAYAGKEVVGWCAVAPRSEYVALNRSRSLAPIDAVEVWSVPCFFIRKDWRRRGLAFALLQSAVKYAKRHGARVIEGYPVDPARGTTADVFAFTGLPGLFLRAGFSEVARRTPTRPMMRLELRPMRAGR